MLLTKQRFFVLQNSKLRKVNSKIVLLTKEEPKQVAPQTKVNSHSEGQTNRIRITPKIVLLTQEESKQVAQQTKILRPSE